MTRILVVEDERIVAKDLSESLERMGYQVIGSAATSQAALDLAAQHLPELVLMDIRISGDVDGIATADVLRNRFGIPVIYLTAYADDETLARAKVTAPLGYIVKPFKSAEIRGAIEVAMVRHKLEREVSDREHWFSTTLRSVGDAVIAVDPDARVRFLNEVAAQLLGVNEADVVGRSIEEVVQLSDERSNEPIENPVRNAIEHRRVGALPETTLLANAPRKQPIEDSCAPIVDDSGRLLGAVMVFRDVTEKRRTQLRLALNDRLVALGTLVAGVAHELSNPLTAIFGHAELIKSQLGRIESLGTTTAREHIAKARESAEAMGEAALLMKDVVSDLRLLSSPQPDALEIVSVRAALELALRRTNAYVSERARVVVEYEADFRVRADRRRLAQVFVNLLTNAAHAIVPGAATSNLISVRLDSTPEGEARVSVQDTGCGMSAEVLRRVFDPFYTTKTIGSGSGLGLAISQGIVRSFQGDIRVVSEVGKGSVFVVVLPVARSEAVC